jgi:hypothetical protein
MPAADDDAIWHLDGDLAVPSEYARGPWSPDAQHGGAPSSLLAGLLERFDPGPADFTARLGIDLMRPVPISPLRVERTVVRPGKKVQIVQGSLFDGDVEVVRATALRIRTVDEPYGDVVPSDLVDPLPPPGEIMPFPFVANRGLGFWDAVEARTPVGAQEAALGRAAVWFRLGVPVIAGEEPSPLQRVAAVADFANGITLAGVGRGYTFINPDLTIVLHRLPAGDWVALDASSFPEDAGIGVAESELHDERGRFGRALQTVILDRRGG